MKLKASPSAGLLMTAIVAVLAVPVVPLNGQTRGRATQPATPTRTEPAKLTCPQVLGDGVQTKRTFCDVLIARDPASGIVVPLPPHTGPVTLTFDLHNRHMYSEELAKTNRGYRRYTATVGVLTMDNTPISMAFVQSEFRTSADLFDRISGGSGPSGLKAIAPTGAETISFAIPAEENSVSIIGLDLVEQRLDGVDKFTIVGRPVAVISNVTLEYRPAPARPPARRR
jgi:hypothetical protein